MIVSPSLTALRKFPGSLSLPLVRKAAAIRETITAFSYVDSLARPKQNRAPKGAA